MAKRRVNREWDVLIFPDKITNEFYKLLDISILKLLYQHDILARKRQARRFEYAWYALALSKRNKLDEPRWAVNAASEYAMNSIGIDGEKDLRITAAQLKKVEKDIRIVRAIHEYMKRSRKMVRHYFGGKNPPTLEDIQKQNSILLEMSGGKQKSNPEKDRHFDEVAIKFDLTTAELRKHYYKISPPIKKGAKKTPPLDTASPFPDPFSA